ncbi:molybdenum cofactor sulfurase isoform X2 [Belonocnema kinseyi]|uniref:molybdenum cofactor sulfurase isoform X2 n=1 Tax=Belonocnema kinseyi TaxID=2817044 RepID=UPI00143D637A|nr:molybdenum cofactor sulfurase isoform X2 [Belonocnema kinseyi]
MDVNHLLSYSEVYNQETVQFLEQEFSRLKGTTLYSKTQIKKASENLLSSTYANPHSVGVASNFTHDLIEQVRYRILDHFYVSSEEYSIIFTSGATAALKIVAETFRFKSAESPDKKIEKNGNFVYLQDNHTSVLGMRNLVSQNGASITCLTHEKAFDIFHKSKVAEKQTSVAGSNSLFVYSAQCNFSGLKYPLEWIKAVQNGKLDSIVGGNGSWYTLLDGSAFVGTNELDLSLYKPDFVCLSFYKMFGYPTGLGALLVKNSSANVLEKVYYGGGTVNVALSSESFHVKRESLHQRFEDGTLPFLSIIALEYGFETISSIPLTEISKHVFSLARHLHHSLLTLHHNNGNPVAKLYSDTDYEDSKMQGGIVTFNILRANADYVGYMEVLSMAALYNIQLRTGCFCNPGACQRHLALSNRTILENYEAGYVCGGSKDLIGGQPTGCVRISFGYMSSVNDVETVLRMVRKCFLNKPEVIKVPTWWIKERERLGIKYKREKYIERMPSITVSILYPSEENTNGKMCRGKVCGHKVEGIDCGAEVSEWLSLSLGRPNLRLIRQTKKKIVEDKRKNEKELSFVSQAQYLLINEASIFWLFDKVPNDSECRRETMLPRFRGNMVVSGCAPFEETKWKHVRIGNCDFQVEGLCTRCQMVCIDQTTGEKTVEPLRTLAEEFHGKLRFGIYLSRPTSEDVILKIGDEVNYTLGD